MVAFLIAHSWMHYFENLPHWPMWYSKKQVSSDLEYLWKLWNWAKILRKFLPCMSTIEIWPYEDTIVYSYTQNPTARNNWKWLNRALYIQFMGFWRLKSVLYYRIQSVSFVDKSVYYSTLVLDIQLTVRTDRKVKRHSWWNSPFYSNDYIVWYGSYLRRYQILHTRRAKWV